MRIKPEYIVFPAFFFVLFAVPAYSGAANSTASGTGKSIGQKAFRQSLKNRFPMSPEQIETLKRRMKETKQTLRRNGPPNMKSRSRKLSFETGEKPPALNIAPGYVTTVSFVDSTGQPWPITSVILGNPNYYSVKRPKGEESIITISARKKFVDSNLALTFKDQDMPATIQMKTVSGKKDTDSLIVFKAQGRGPNARAPAIGPGPKPTINDILMSFLDRVPPGQAKRVKLKPQEENMSLWSYQDFLYFRTEYPVLWPAWMTVARGVSGVRVYKLPRVTSLMVSRNGKTESFQIRSPFHDRK